MAGARLGLHGVCRCYSEPHVQTRKMGCIGLIGFPELSQVVADWTELAVALNTSLCPMLAPGARERCGGDCGLSAGF